jgi:hypothetical protein
VPCVAHLARQTRPQICQCDLILFSTVFKDASTLHEYMQSEIRSTLINFCPKLNLFAGCHHQGDPDLDTQLQAQQATAAALHASKQAPSQLDVMS